MLWALAVGAALMHGDQHPMAAEVEETAEGGGIRSLCVLDLDNNGTISIETSTLCIWRVFTPFR